MEISPPEVSFIVTSFNYDLYILKTLESIKNQTFKSFEIIIVDDFSQDNSTEIIENFINQNPQLFIKFIKHDKNYGQLKSIQTGIENSKGKYISFIDSDDILMETYAEELTKILDISNISFVSSQLIFIDKNDEIIKENIDIKNSYKTLNSTNAPFGGWYWQAMSSAMFKKKFIEIVQKYENFADWRICPDKFLFNFANLVNSSAVLHKSLVKKRKHEKNAGIKNRTKLNFSNNLKIRPQTFKFILKNKKYFIEQYGKLKTYSFLLNICFSYFYTPIQILHYVKKSIISKIQPSKNCYI